MLRVDLSGYLDCFLGVALFVCGFGMGFGFACAVWF